MQKNYLVDTFISCLPSTFDLRLYQSVIPCDYKPTKHCTNVFKASTCTSLEKFYVEECDNFLNDPDGVKPKVNTDMTMDPLLCFHADMDNVDSLVRVRFNSGSASRISNDLNQTCIV